MLPRLADLGLRAPRRVLLFAGLLIVLAGAFGASAAAHLSSGGFQNPGSSSTRAADLLASRFDAGDVNLVLEVTSPAGADSAAARARGVALTNELRAAHYASQVSSYWTAPAGQAASLRSTDGHSALVVARVAGDDSTAPERAGRIVDGLDRRARMQTGTGKRVVESRAAVIA